MKQEQEENVVIGKINFLNEYSNQLRDLLTDVSLDVEQRNKLTQKINTIITNMNYDLKNRLHFGDDLHQSINRGKAILKRLETGSYSKGNIDLAKIIPDNHDEMMDDIVEQPLITQNKENIEKKILELTDEINRFKIILDNKEHEDIVEPEQRFAQIIKGFNLSSNSKLIVINPKDDDTILFEYDKITNECWVSYDKIWKVFKDEYKYNFDKITDLVNRMVKKHFGWNYVTSIPTRF